MIPSPFIDDVADELARAESAHRRLNSLHEAYSVILEEVDELWDLCRLKAHDRDPTEVRGELIQIAAMAWRTARNLGLEPRVLQAPPQPLTPNPNPSPP